MATEFGKRLKAARAHAKLSQKALSERVGISQGTVSELETIGHGSAYTYQIALACKVNPGWLAEGDGDMLDLSASYGAGERVVPFTSAATTIGKLRDLLRSVPEMNRDAVASRLNALALAPDSDMVAARLLELLNGAAQSRAASKPLRTGP